MKNYGLLLLAILVFAILLLSCGTSSHKLQSVSINPANADALDYPNGQVPFIATGYYDSRPSPVTPLSATWGACYQDGSTTEVIVSAAGLAQCAPGATGVFTVWAFSSNPENAVCGAINACGGGCGRITGTAQLTCP
jgi:hypothetical protein